MLAVMAAVMFAAAGTWRWSGGWWFVGLFGAISLVVSVWLLFADPALLQERLKPPVQRGQDRWDRLFMGVVMVVAPLLVWLGACYDPPAVLQRPARWIGELSYPVYAIHYPLMFLWLFVAKRLHLPIAAQFVSYLLLTVSLAWALNRVWDAPLRRWLTARLPGAAPTGVTGHTPPAGLETPLPGRPWIWRTMF